MIKEFYSFLIKIISNLYYFRIKANFLIFLHYKYNKNMKYNIPQVGIIELDTIILDLNGTISIKGVLIDGIKDKIIELHKSGFDIYLLSGDQRGNAEKICTELNIHFHKATSSQEKEDFVKSLKTKNTVAIGNARIDIGMFKVSKLSIGTLQEEGIHVEILKHIDILVKNIHDAFDLLLDEDSFKATMRK